MHREPLEEELLSLGKRAGELDEKGRISLSFLPYAGITISNEERIKECFL